MLMQQQFFPSSDRPELHVELRLSQSASIYNVNLPNDFIAEAVILTKGYSNARLCARASKQSLKSWHACSRCSSAR